MGNFEELKNKVNRCAEYNYKAKNVQYEIIDDLIKIGFWGNHFDDVLAKSALLAYTPDIFVRIVSDAMFSSRKEI